MSDRKGFLLRLDPHLMSLLKAWAEDDFRSLNGQIEYLLKQSLKERGRWKAPTASTGDAQQDTPENT